MAITASTRNHVSSKETGFDDKNSNNNKAHTRASLSLCRLSRLTCSALNTGVADVSRYMDSRLAIGADIISSVGNGGGEGEGQGKLA